jgi:hypothetical protein
MKDSFKKDEEINKSKKFEEIGTQYDEIINNKLNNNINYISNLTNKNFILHIYKKIIKKLIIQALSADKASSPFSKY